MNETEQKEAGKTRHQVLAVSEVRTGSVGNGSGGGKGSTNPDKNLAAIRYKGGKWGPIT